MHTRQLVNLDQNISRVLARDCTTALGHGYDFHPVPASPLTSDCRLSLSLHRWRSIDCVAVDFSFGGDGFSRCLSRWNIHFRKAASHVEPTVLLTMQGTRSLERELHARFAAAHHDREWFRMTDEIKTLIASESDV